MDVVRGSIAEQPTLAHALETARPLIEERRHSLVVSPAALLVQVEPTVIGSLTTAGTLLRLLAYPRSYVAIPRTPQFAPNQFADAKAIS
jgi:hypothetical protein